MNLPTLPTDNYSKFWSVVSFAAIVLLMIYLPSRGLEHIQTMHQLANESITMMMEADKLDKSSDAYSFNLRAINDRIKLNQILENQYSVTFWSQFFAALIVLAISVIVFGNGIRKWKNDQKKINAQQDLEFKIKKLELEKIEYEVGRLK